MLIQHARLRGGQPADRPRLAAALERVSLSALGLPPRATLVLGRVVAPAPLPREGSPEPFVRRLEETLRRCVAAARHGGGGWLFEDEATLEVALVAAWLERTASSATLLRLVAGGAAPELRLRWRRAILPDGDAAARTISRLAEAGLAAPWLAGFAPAELEVAAERIRASHGAAGPVPVHTPSAPRQRAAAVNLARTLRALAPEAGSLPAGTPARQLLLTALAARRRPALLPLPEFVHAIRAAADPAAAPPQTARPSPAPAAGHPLRTSTLPNPGPAAPKTPAPPQAESASPPLPDTPWTMPAPFPWPTCRTGFGGLLFLLNALVALNLFGDFSRPRSVLPGLSPFELLLLLGRHWYGPAFAADPLHASLRHWAGLQPGEAPGSHFAAPAWSVLADWLTPWPDSPPRRRGSVAWHAAGFPLAGPARRRFWVAALGRYLAARLAAALGTPDPRAARDRVCRRAGELRLGPDSVVLLLSLADHPLEIRFAGLDRDPGRLAGTERAISFEFSA